MQDHNQRGGWEHRQQMRASAASMTCTSVLDLVFGSDGRTVHEVRSRSLAWPGVNGVDPEPIACLEAARELERTARAVQVDYVRLARQAGRSWYEIGQALDLHWAAAANKEPIADEAYSYALRAVPESAARTLTWECPACHRVITDKGPYGDLPGREEGHEAACPRWGAELAAWQERSSAD